MKSSHLSSSFKYITIGFRLISRNRWISQIQCPLQIASLVRLVFSCCLFVLYYILNYMSCSSSPKTSQHILVSNIDIISGKIHFLTLAFQNACNLLWDINITSRNMHFITCHFRMPNFLGITACMTCHMFPTFPFEIYSRKESCWSIQ